MNHKVMVKALDVIKDSVVNTEFPLTNKLADAIYAIETELAKPEQDKPWRLSPMYEYGHIYDSAQPEREWNGLSETEIRGCTCECVDNGTFAMACAIDFARALEATLKDRNTTNQ